MTTKYATQYKSTLSAPPLVRELQLTPAANIVFYSWWHGDPPAQLAHLPGFGVEIASDCRLIATMSRINLDEALARVRAGHRPYLARLGGVPVAYGWSAARRASIGELGLEFAVPAGDRYLWDFATLPIWRGRGIYPRLLHAIIQRELAEAARFWIGHADDNYASMRGILKAGFGAVGTARQHGRAVGFAAAGPAARAQACAELLGLEISVPQ